jgi:hypothetical protein
MRTLSPVGQSRVGPKESRTDLKVIGPRNRGGEALRSDMVRRILNDPTLGVLWQNTANGVRRYCHKVVVSMEPR